MDKGWYKVNKAVIRDIDALKKELTIPPFMGDGEPMYCFDESDTHVGVPHNYGEANYGLRWDYTEGTDAEYTHFPDPNHPMAPKGQPALFNDTLTAMRDVNRIIVVAQTGAGKTALVLHTAARLGKAALIVAPTDALLDQWYERATSSIGLNLSEDKIGRIQQGTCDYVGKTIVLASMQSLQARRYEDGLYDYFGFLGFDEVHKFAADKMSQTLSQFNAKYQIGVTATLKRADTKDKVLRMWLGEPAVTASGMKPVPINYTFITYKHKTLPKKVMVYANKIKYLTGDLAEINRQIANSDYSVARMLQQRKRAINSDLMEARKISVSIYKHELAADEKRTDALCDMIMKMYNKDKVILGLSCSTKQLQYAQSRLISLGVPEHKVCIFADKLYTGLKTMSFSVNHKSLIQYIKSNKKVIETNFNCVVRVSVKSVTVNGECLNDARVRKNITVALRSQMMRVTNKQFNLWKGKLHREPVGVVQSLICGAGKMTLKDKMLQTSKSRIREILTDKSMRIYLATYGVMSMGVDVPWLNCGMDMTPQKAATQEIGRVIRLYKGKTRAYWFSPVDIGYPSGLDKVNAARKKELKTLDYVTIKER